MTIRAWLSAVMRFAGSALLRMGGHSRPVLSTGNKPRSMNFDSTHFVDVDELLPDYDPRAEGRAPRLKEVVDEYGSGEMTVERIAARRLLGDEDPLYDLQNNIHRCYPTLRAYYVERVSVIRANGGDLSKLPSLPRRSNFRTIAEFFSRST